MAVKQFRFDSRRRTLWLAIALVLAAVLVSAALLQQSTSTKVYLVANRDLNAGTMLTPNDVRQVQAGLGITGTAYMQSFTIGQSLRLPVLAGELIPRSAAANSLDEQTKAVRVTPSAPLSTRIRTGSRVQLWFVPKSLTSQTTSSAVQLLANAEVLAIIKGESNLGKQIDDVEIGVPAGNLTAVITAIASAGYVSVISES
jgi:Flp pilus assembly protein CpaB